MKIRINFMSFILSFVCIVLFLISIYSSSIIEVTTNLVHIHPLFIVLGISIITCLLGFIGLYEAVNWKLLLRGFWTIAITFILSGFITFVGVIGYLVQ